MEPERIAFTIGGLPIYWYGICIALGVFCGILLGMRNAKRRGLSPDIVIDISLLIIPLALIFARVYYVAFSWEDYASEPMRIFSVREGGMALYGGVIGGVIGVLIASKWKRLAFVDLADMLVAGLALGQAIGRWGNFFNREAYGIAISNPSWQFFPAAVPIGTQWHAATFFYESIFCLLLAIALYLYGRKPRARGLTMVWYFIGYGMERAIVEALRTDSLWLGHLRVSQILSLVLALGGLCYLAIRGRRSAGFFSLGYGVLWGLLSVFGLELFGNPAIELALAGVFILGGIAMLLLVRDKSAEEDGAVDEALRIFKSPRTVEAIVVEELLIEDDSFEEDEGSKEDDSYGELQEGLRPAVVPDDDDEPITCAPAESSDEEPNAEDGIVDEELESTEEAADESAVTTNEEEGKTE